MITNTILQKYPISEIEVIISIVRLLRAMTLSRVKFYQDKNSISETQDTQRQTAPLLITNGGE